MSEHVQTCVVCPHNPKRATGGALVCFDCSNRILRWLRELEEYLPTLPLIKDRKSSERGSPGFRSTPPLNLDAVLHTDPRSDSSDRHGHITDELGALGVIDSWVRVLVEEHGVTPPKAAYLGLPLLRASHAWITCQPWVSEYADDLRKVHGAVRATAGDPIPQPVGRCIVVDDRSECGGPVFETADLAGVQCARCGETYTGLALVRLRVAQQEAS